MYLRSELHVVMSVRIFALKRCSVRLYLQLFVGGHIVICVCLRIVGSETYSVVFFFVLCTPCCQIIWIVNFFIALRYFLTFIILHHCFMPVMFQLLKLFYMSALSIIYSTYITSNKGSLSPFIFSRPFDINIDRIWAYYTLLKNKIGCYIPAIVFWRKQHCKLHCISLHADTIVAVGCT